MVFDAHSDIWSDVTVKSIRGATDIFRKYHYEILKKGSETARERAAKTLSDVKNAMKINYFDDKELIKAQSEKYSNISE